MILLASIFTRERLGDGLYGIVTDGGRQMWSRVRLRKRAECVVCGAILSARVDAYRPITNLKNRSWRICAGCVEG